MMNWFLNFYFGEGPGIDKNAPKPKGLKLLGAVLAREWWELLKLNVLFIAFALPLVTIPAAWFAAISVSVAMLEDRNVWLLRDFWAAFRKRFVLTTVLGFGFCVGEALAVLAITTYAGAATDQLVFAAPLSIAIVIALACRSSPPICSWRWPYVPISASRIFSRSRPSLFWPARLRASRPSPSWRLCGSPTSFFIPHRSCCRCWSISPLAHWC